jgi:hypothetical protein
MNRTIRVAVALAALALAAGCASQRDVGTSTPVLHQVTPPPAPTCPTTLHGHQNDPAASRAALVPGTPDVVTICRYAGLNDPNPGSLVKKATARQATATALAHALDTAKVFPSGTPYSCPADSGRTNLLMFGYTDGHQADVTMDTSGCRTASNGPRTVFYSSAVTAQVTALVGTETTPAH